MQKYNNLLLFSIFVSRSSTVLSRISICSIEAPIKKTYGTQRKPQKITEKVPFLFWGGLQDMFSIVKNRKDVGWSPFVGRWTTKARTRTCVLASVGHVAPRWRLKADVELFWPPVAKWLPECSGNLILNTSSLRWPSGFQNVPGISF